MANAKTIRVTGLGPMCAGVTHVSHLTQMKLDPVGATWFDAEQYLGKRGHKYCTEPTRYLLAAVKGALDDAQLNDGAYQAQEIGIAVGTNYATWEITQRFDLALKTGGSAELQPMEAPCFSINIPASEASRRHAFRAFCLTLTSPFVAGMQALVVGIQSLQSERAQIVVAGATEHGIPGFDGSAADQCSPEGACAIILQSSANQQESSAYTVVLDDYFWATFHDAADWNRVIQWVDDRTQALPQPSSSHLTLVSEVSCALSHSFLEALDQRQAGKGRIDRLTSGSSVIPLLKVAELVATGRSGIVLCCSQSGQIIAVSLRSQQPEL